MKPRYTVHTVKAVVAWTRIEEDGNQAVFYDDNEVVGTITYELGSHVVRVGLISAVFPNNSQAQSFLLGVMAGSNEQDKVNA